MGKPKGSKRAGANESKLSEFVVRVFRGLKIFKNFVPKIPEKDDETTNGDQYTRRIGKTTDVTDSACDIRISPATP
jgi:hypothetical protein